MIITHKLHMDLEGKEPRKRIEVSQWDSGTRRVRLALLAGGTDWEIPGDVSVLIHYQKPDGTTGCYDTMPDGSCAWQASGNTLTLCLAPQVMDAAGVVLLQASLLRQEEVLHTFSLEIGVKSVVAAKARLDGGFASVTGILMAPETAEAGQFLQVAQVDEGGRVTRLQAAEIPSDTLDEEQVREVVAECLAEADTGIYILEEGETPENAPADADVVIDPNGQGQESLAKSDWNAAEGEAGYILNKPFGVTTGEILPETTLTADESEPGGFYTSITAEMTVGQEYTVNWNGTEYVCTAEDLSALTDGEMPGVMLGNTAIFGGVPPEEYPFAIAFCTFALFDDCNVAMMDLDGATSVTVSIRGETVKKIDPRFLPGGVVYLYGAKDEYNYLYNSADTSNPANRTTLPQLKEIVASGKTVWFTTISGTIYTYTPCTIVWNDELGYGGVYIGIPGLSATNANYNTAEYVGQT